MIQRGNVANHPVKLQTHPDGTNPGGYALRNKPELRTRGRRKTRAERDCSGRAGTGAASNLLCVLGEAVV